MAILCLWIGLSWYYWCQQRGGAQWNICTVRSMGIWCYILDIISFPSVIVIWIIRRSNYSSQGLLMMHQGYGCTTIYGIQYKLCLSEFCTGWSTITTLITTTIYNLSCKMYTCSSSLIYTRILENKCSVHIILLNKTANLHIGVDVLDDKGSVDD